MQALARGQLRPLTTCSHRVKVLFSQNRVCVRPVWVTGNSGRCLRTEASFSQPRTTRTHAMATRGARLRPLASSAADNVAKFADGLVDEFTLCVLGDLHLQPRDQPLFDEAAGQMNELLAAAGPGNGRVVQLGDVGGYKDKPGSRECFETASRWLDTLASPRLLVTGNHDLEGEEFETDEENLAAWQQAFQQHHYWRVSLGPTELIGLSTVRYRSNKDSVHEVHIDDEQVEWFERQLAEIDPSRPVLVFTHAPPIGCGLKALHKVHVKNRCAWLNHSSRPHVFPDLVRRHPNVKLWFSGHYHLSHDYARSIGTLGGCAFVTVNVIGSYNRDGLRQSRVLKGNPQGYELYTLDHGSGALRLDARQDWASSSPPEVIPADHLLDEDVQFDAVATEYAWGSFDEPTASCRLPQTAAPNGGSGGSCANAFVRTGPHSAISVSSGGVLLEYDLLTGAAIGALALDVGDARVVPVDEAGRELQAENLQDGTEVAAVELREESGHVVDRITRNEEGGLYRIYQPNKWRKQQQEKAAAAAAAAVSA